MPCKKSHNGGMNIKLNVRIHRMYSLGNAMFKPLLYAIEQCVSVPSWVKDYGPFLDLEDWLAKINI
jgi:hypothetical protein